MFTIFAFLSFLAYLKFGFSDTFGYIAFLLLIVIAALDNWIVQKRYVTHRLPGVDKHLP